MTRERVIQSERPWGKAPGERLGQEELEEAWNTRPEAWAFFLRQGSDLIGPGWEWTEGVGPMLEILEATTFFLPSSGQSSEGRGRVLDKVRGSRMRPGWCQGGPEGVMTLGQKKLGPLSTCGLSSESGGVPVQCFSPLTSVFMILIHNLAFSILPCLWGNMTDSWAAHILR